MTVTAYGMDTSHFQTITSAAQAHADGLSFAWGKCTQATNYADPKYAASMASLSAAGFIVAPYHFATSAGSAAAQVAWLKAHAGAHLGTKGKLRPLLDMEDASLQMSLAHAWLAGNKIEHGEDPQSMLARGLHATQTLAASVGDEEWAQSMPHDRLLLKTQAAAIPIPVTMPAGGVDRWFDLAETLTASANAFINSFYDALGIPLVVYGNLAWWQTIPIFRPSSWGSRDILGAIARYNGDPGNPGYTYPKMAVHQHSSTATVPGVTPEVDRDVIFNGFTLASLTLGGSTPAPTPGGLSDVALNDKLDPIKLSDGSTYQLTVADVLEGLAQLIPGNGTPGPNSTGHPTGQYNSRILEISTIGTAVDALGDQVTAAAKAASDAAAAQLAATNALTDAVKALAASPAAPTSGVTADEVRALLAGTTLTPPTTPAI